MSTFKLNKTRNFSNGALQTIQKSSLSQRYFVPHEDLTKRFGTNDKFTKYFRIQCMIHKQDDEK